MGTFSVILEIGGPAGERFESIEALVDTGATYTMVPAPILERLGVRRHTRDAFVLADGRRRELDLGHAWVRIDDRTVITLVVFGDPESAPLLGTYTLEGLRLAPSPIGRTLVPVPGLLMVSTARPTAAAFQQNGICICRKGCVTTFKESLRDLGWVEGSTARARRAAELVRLPVDVMFAGNAPSVRAAMTATRAIPIVMVSGQVVDWGR